MRPIASLVNTDVHAWVARRVEQNSTSNEADQVGGVWVQMTHDPDSDGLLISTDPVGP